jgi:hypothetical protein
MKLFSYPNCVAPGDGFYVSYNDTDLNIYGCRTTALVLGPQMEKFYILNGDHRAQYTPLIGQGFDACLAYFKANLGLVNMRSDAIAV